jgi:hypothetical protein
MKYFLILLMYSTQASAFYLITNTGAAFKSKEVKVYITSNSTCTNAGVSNSELLDITIDGVNKFWNRVPTANLKLVRGGTLQTSNSKYLTEELCASDSNTTCPEATSVPTGNDIIIACNNNATNFPSSSLLALSAPISVSVSQIKGSVILINDTATSSFNTLSRSEMVSVMAHEIGHAIGLGHTDKTQALMHSKKSDTKNRLSQDDIRGISYLYPNKLDGCTGIFGTVNFQSPPNDNNNFFLNNYLQKFSLSLILGLSIGILTFSFYRFFTGSIATTRQSPVA